MFQFLIIILLIEVNTTNIITKKKKKRVRIHDENENRHAHEHAHGHAHGHANEYKVNENRVGSQPKLLKKKNNLKCGNVSIRKLIQRWAIAFCDLGLCLYRQNDLHCQGYFLYAIWISAARDPWILHCYAEFLLYDLNDRKQSLEFFQKAYLLDASDPYYFCQM
ncbi:hypothetical protein RFI_20154, partial [Reticulomyxa filosa]